MDAIPAAINRLKRYEGVLIGIIQAFRGDYDFKYNVERKCFEAIPNARLTTLADEIKEITREIRELENEWNNRQKKSAT